MLNQGLPRRTFHRRGLASGREPSSANQALRAENGGATASRHDLRGGVSLSDKWDRILATSGD